MRGSRTSDFDAQIGDWSTGAQGVDAGNLLCMANTSPIVLVVDHCNRT